MTPTKVNTGNKFKTQKLVVVSLAKGYQQGETDTLKNIPSKICGKKRKKNIRK